MNIIQFPRPPEILVRRALATRAAHIGSTAPTIASAIAAAITTLNEGRSIAWALSVGYRHLQKQEKAA